MNNPFSYIAEAPSFSAGEILLALLVLLLVFAGFVLMIVVGFIAFLRLGQGHRGWFATKLAPAIGVLDVLFFLATVRETLVFAIAPLAVHALALALGRNTTPSQPPPPNQPPPPGSQPPPPG